MVDSESTNTDNLPLVHLHRPGTVETASPAAILIHGRGANERDLLPIGVQLPDELDILSVRAPQSMPRPGSFTWYDLDIEDGDIHQSQPEPDGFQESLEMVHSFVAEAIEGYNLDADRIGLLGFSQGAIMALSALVGNPEQYRWIVALNGYLAASHESIVENAAGKPVFIGCGSQDQLIPAARAKRAADRLRDAGADVRFERYPVGHATTPSEVTDIVSWVETHY